MTTKWWVIAFAAAAVGAQFHVALPLAVVLAAAALMCVVRRPALLVVTLFVWTSWWSFTSWKALDSPLPSQVNGVAKLVTDPEQRRFATEADVTVAGRRWRAAFDASCSDVLIALAGDKVRIDATVSHLRGLGAPAARRRHLAGRLAVKSCGTAMSARGLASISNAIRRVTDHGVRNLPTDQRALVKGLVFGDGREQSAVMRAQFQQSGLTHLLVVSGENVTFVLFAVGGLVQRLAARRRMMVLVAVLVLFGTLTRWQPSVLRALTMVGVTMTAELSGRPVDRGRRLCVAVVVLLAIDPFLVGSISFLLSTGACAGLVVLFGPLRRRLRGAMVADALAGTVAAQLGTLPVSALMFGVPDPISVVTNVLAAPFAAALSTWATVMSIPAGAMGPVLAVPVGVVTRALATCLLAIAALPQHPMFLVALLAVSSVVAVAFRQPMALGMLIALSGWTLLPAHPPPECFGGDVTMVTPQRDVVKAAECLRRSSRRETPILVVTDDGALADARAVIAARVVLARRETPPIRVGYRYRAGSHVVTIDAVAPRLVVSVTGA